jgi:hypothetical protein
VAIGMYFYTKGCGFVDYYSFGKDGDSMVMSTLIGRNGLTIKFRDEISLRRVDCNNRFFFLIKVVANTFDKRYGVP